MFTGIIEETGVVRNVTERRLTVGAKTVLESAGQGESISVNGVCLTVINIDKDAFTVETMPETIRRTTIGRLHYGDKVNLERAMAAGGRFGGHFVQGHIDDTGSVLSVTPERDAVILRVTAPKTVMHYIVEKGFIAVDGASLTVIARDDISFSVSLVGYTLEHTILGQRKPGDEVNLEIDIIAKYVESFMTANKSGGVILDFLRNNDRTATR